MSYIRSGSNPEHLYIWGEGNDVLSISVDGKLIRVSSKEWCKLIAKWARTHKNVIIGDLSLSEEMIFEEGIDVPKWVLRHNKKIICKMWHTTMYYIAFSNQHKWIPKIKVV